MLLLSPKVATFLIFFFTRITAVKLFKAIFQQISAQQSYGAVYCVFDLCCTCDYYMAVSHKDRELLNARI